MSKSKRNTVDLDEIAGTAGADTARWFMLSDSPPERDVIWTEEGAQGAWRFVQRIWRLVGDAAQDRGRHRGGPARRNSAKPQRRCARRRTARSAHVTDDIERLRFNVCVAHIYEFANAFGTSLAGAKGDAGADYRFARARSRRNPGQADLADDAASGRGMLGGAGAQGRTWFHGPIGLKLSPICW